jgi:hypothetical protein
MKVKLITMAVIAGALAVSATGSAALLPAMTNERVT